MAETRDVIIIGGGHNGLVTAFYLAKAGFKPLVLERRAQAGGAAITEEFSSGFRCSTLAHSAGPLLPEIVIDMQLARHGLKLVTPEVAVTALSPDGRALVLYNDGASAAQEIAKFSPKDAERYPVFQQSLTKIGRVISDALKACAAQHRRSQSRRSLGHAPDRTRTAQAGQERHVPAAALGADGRRRSGRRIF